MSVRFTTLPIDPAQAARAFPLVQSAAPDITLERWTAFAAALDASTPPRSGMVAVEDSRGYLQGLAIFTIRPDLHYDRVLLVHSFIAMDRVHRDAAARALLEAVETAGREAGCGAVQLLVPDLPTGNVAVAGVYRASGHRVETLCLSKALR